MNAIIPNSMDGEAKEGSLLLINTKEVLIKREQQYIVQ